MDFNPLTGVCYKMFGISLLIVRKLTQIWVIENMEYVWFDASGYAFNPYL